MITETMLKLTKILLLVFFLQLCLLPLAYSDTSVEFGVEDDLTVNGTAGTSADADLEVKGYSVFGDGTGATSVTSGAGSLYIQNNLELGGSAYLLGNSGIGTTTVSARLQIKGADTGTGFTLRLQDNDKTDQVAFLDNGNVGIGTTAPITQLHIPGKVPIAQVGSVVTGSNPHYVYVQGRYAYVTNYGNNTFQIFDVSNPASPVSKSSVASGTAPHSVYVQGRYAYMTNDTGGSMLQIFDVSNPSSPISVGSVAAGTSPQDIYVQGRYAYVIDMTGPMNIFDVSNPASPAKVSSINTGTNTESVYVQGRYAYTLNVGGSTDSLRIFDVSNPASPAAAGSVAIILSDNFNMHIYVQGRYAYVLNTVLQIFDVSNPASPSKLGSASVTEWTPVSVYVQGRYAYVLTNAYLQIFDVSNPSSPTSVGTVATGTEPLSVYVQGRYAYVTNYSDNTLQIFDVGGSYIQQLETGGLETGTLATRSNAQVGNDLDVRGGLQVGRGIETTGPFSVYGGGTGSNFIVNYDGNVGIGTTNPSARLHIEGNLKAKMQTDLGGNAAVWAGSTDDAVYELGYDVAETFETIEEVSPGDLLISDSSGKLKRSTQPYQENIIGVVSAAPALLFEGSQLQINPQPLEFKVGTKPPVALSGRVKLKVTTENGFIRTGDYLTSSSKPGYAMKATQSSRVIGLALENADQEGQITVFINPHWYGADFTAQTLRELKVENETLKEELKKIEERTKKLKMKFSRK